MVLSHLPSPDKLPSACELRSAEIKVKKKTNQEKHYFGGNELCKWGGAPVSGLYPSIGCNTEEVYVGQVHKWMNEWSMLFFQQSFIVNNSHYGPNAYVFPKFICWNPTH